MDNGKGISKEDIPHLFEAFYTKNKKGGTGLGLAFCKQAIEAHGGSIEVESEVGKGATFTIKIPDCVICHPRENGDLEYIYDEEEIPDQVGNDMVCQNDSMNNYEVDPSQKHAGMTQMDSSSSIQNDKSLVKPKNVTLNLNNKKIAIIDDDENVRIYWRKKIKDSGGTIIQEWDSGDKVVNGNGFDWSQIDLAIVDYSYPDTNVTGVDVIAYLKTKGIKEIHLCTGFADDPDIQKAAMNAGADSVIGKA